MNIAIFIIYISIGAIEATIEWIADIISRYHCRRQQQLMRSRTRRILAEEYKIVNRSLKKYGHKR